MSESSPPDDPVDAADLSAQLSEIYESMEGSTLAADYAARHGIESAPILTVHSDETADLIASYLAPKIEGKTVIEIGGGIGLLALHLSSYAKRIFCIEANPMWSWTFAALLLAKKPKNLSYLFGAAEEFEGLIRADVALFCTHSDSIGFRQIASRFAPVVIDVYGDLCTSEDNELRALTWGSAKKQGL